MNSQFPSLCKGDIIEIIAPAGAVPRKQQSQSLIRAAEFITELGFIPSLDSNIFSDNNDPFSANSLEYRANSLIKAVKNNKVRAIWCMRGGYGSAQLIPSLESYIPAQDPKLILGFSDITAIHLFVQKCWQWPSLHSKVLYQFLNKDDQDVTENNRLRELLLGEIENLEYNLTPLNELALLGKIVSGEVIGGNMSIIQCSIGTNWEIASKNKILFFEDTNERGYRLDRIFCHFEQAGIFRNVKAVVIGDISPANEPGGKDLTKIAVDRFIFRMNIPVYRIFGVGHEKINNPLPFGIRTIIQNNKINFVFK